MSSLQTETYLFTSKPQPVSTGRYRDPQNLEATLLESANIMWDPRIMRGPTVGKPMEETLRRTQQYDPDGAYGRAKRKQQRRAAKTLKRQLVESGAIRPKLDSVETIHKNIKVQKKRTEVPLHLYLIEQSTPTVTHTVDSQTDAFLDEPVQPQYIAPKTGVDASTQVDNAQVFDYDQDVIPILEVVVSKTIEQGLMEVREEEELKAMREHKEEMTQRLKRQEEERQRKLKAERARFAERKQRLAAARRTQQERNKLRDKMAAHKIAQKYLEELQNQRFDGLYHQHYFFDPLRREVEQFLPWLYTKVGDHLSQTRNARNLIADITTHAISKLEGQASEQHATRRAEEKRKHQIETTLNAYHKEMRKLQTKIQLYIHTNVIDNSPVGPIELTGQSTVGDIENKVLDWLHENVDDPPDASRISFTWNGTVLNNASVLYNLGVENLATIQMEVEPLPHDSDNEEEEDEDMEEI